MGRSVRIPSEPKRVLESDLDVLRRRAVAPDDATDQGAGALQSDVGNALAVERQHARREPGSREQEAAAEATQDESDTSEAAEENAEDEVVSVSADSEE